MTTSATSGSASRPDFLKFWFGQSISNLGSSITLLAIPLLIYERTSSAVYLSLASVSGLLPYLLFGLPIGAWVDRVDRKRLMIWTDYLRAAVVATIPLLAAFDALPLAWIFAVAFVNATLTIAFNAAEFAAIPSLVDRDELVTANGRIQATYAGSMVVGPILAGALAGVISVESVVAINAATYVASALSLAWIAATFNHAGEARRTTTIRADIGEGLRYVFGHPVLRAISLMMAIFNCVAMPLQSQLVLFARERLNTGEGGVGILYAAGSIGVVVMSLLAGRVRGRWPFSRVILGALLLNGALTVAIAALTSFAAALPVFAVLMGVGVLFNINTGSLRQSIVPSELLGRVITVAGVMAMSLSPLGAFVSGVLVEWTGSVALVIAGSGVLMMLVAGGFALSALGHAERYLPGGDLELLPARDAEPEPRAA